MKKTPMTAFKFLIDSAIRNTEDKRPTKDSATPALAEQYIQIVLDTVFAGSGIETKVQSMDYHGSGKIPLIISAFDREQYLLWYYPYVSSAELALELEGILNDLAADLYGDAA